MPSLDMTFDANSGHYNGLEECNIDQITITISGVNLCLTYNKKGIHGVWNKCRDAESVVS